ncbi:long-chain fatty acid--CoA ligase [Verminephrobacter eiseniae]|uniref:class I adenylate-forming enzyme family protein n=1 Tax=Verminephrobacter eiseniae TaxID=364317 RepID=UPI002238DCC2|nr:class I adenylate-forming enzyme family protein [Verminephrobacter eiseniae]MCW5262540.1 long-chain fatty acid--CoA ligase [Verminephrobacter eiseniae]
MSEFAKLQARNKLFNDPKLGAGNFLFKAHAAYGGGDEDFLFLEKPYVGPSGAAYQAFSLSSLFLAVRDLAAWYQHQGIRAGRRVCLYLGDGIPSFLHFLALGSLGCIPVLINGHLRADLANSYAQRNGFDVFIYDQETNARWNLADILKSLSVFNAGFVQGTAVPLDTPVIQDWPVTVSDPDIVMICHSSGTTGIPKAVLFGHAQFFNGKRERLLGFIEQAEDKLATAMPPTHAAGVSYLMTAVLLQLPTLALATQTGIVAANLIAGFQPSIITAFPQSYASFAELDLPDGYFRSVQRFYNTGDTAHEAHIRQLLRLAPNGRFTDMFGASELGMSQFFKVSTADKVATKRTVGPAAAYAHCAILSPQGEALAEGVPGYIGVRSPTVTPGYYGQPHLTALTTLNGYWLTGDIGLRQDDGEFIHLDRIVDVVPTSFGEPAYTLLLEEHMLRRPKIFDVSVTGVSRGPTREEAVLILVRGAEGKTVDAEEVLRHALACYPFYGHGSLPDYTLCVGILNPNHVFPVGSTGKVLKRMLREQFWNEHRDFDEGCREIFHALLWNQALVAVPVSPHGPQNLCDYLRA